MTDEQATVFIIDDDDSVRDAIIGVVTSVGMRAVAFASTRELLLKPPQTGTSCLILDVRLQGSSGLDFQQELARAGIDIPIIFITGYGDVPMTVRAMKAGAVEFLTKPFRDQDLLDAIALALEKDRAALKHRGAIDGLRNRYATLTKRERQVMALVVAGKLTKEIAAELGTSEITIKVHRGQIMRKMEARSIVELVKMTAKLETTIP
jgi:FixJ family two-component response regulator